MNDIFAHGVGLYREIAVVIANSGDDDVDEYEKTPEHKSYCEIGRTLYSTFTGIETAASTSHIDYTVPNWFNQFVIQIACESKATKHAQLQFRTNFGNAIHLKNSIVGGSNRHMLSNLNISSIVKGVLALVDRNNMDEAWNIAKSDTSTLSTLVELLNLFYVPTLDVVDGSLHTESGATINDILSCTPNMDCYQKYCSKVGPANAKRVSKAPLLAHFTRNNSNCTTKISVDYLIATEPITRGTKLSIGNSSPRDTVLRSLKMNVQNLVEMALHPDGVVDGDYIDDRHLMLSNEFIDISTSSINCEQVPTTADTLLDRTEQLKLFQKRTCEWTVQSATLCDDKLRRIYFDQVVETVQGLKLQL